MLHTEAHQPIILFGNTLFMTGVEMALSRRLDQSILRLSESQPDLADIVRQLHPGLVVFDLEDPQADQLVLALKELIDVPLLGLDRARRSSRLLSSRPLNIDTMDRLARIIEHETRFLPAGAPLFAVA